MKIEQQFRVGNQNQACRRLAVKSLMLAATLFSVLLDVDESQTGEQMEEQQQWELHMKERRKREEQRQNERQEALERERRELEKLEQERVMCHLNLCTSCFSDTFSKDLELRDVSQ